MEKAEIAAKIAELKASEAKAWIDVCKLIEEA